MKTKVILVLTLGLVGAIAKPSEEKTPEPTVNKSEPKTITEENAIIDIINNEAANTAINEIPIDIEKESNYGASIDIFMEENIKNPPNLLLDQADEPNFESEFLTESDESIYNDVLNKDPNEIMDTAAGFVPIPIFRNRQKAKRRFATRRQFSRKPYPRRRIYFFYPSYGFYPHSSLRFY